MKMELYYNVTRLIWMKWRGRNEGKPFRENDPAVPEREKFVTALVSQLERGIGNPSLSVLRAIASTLGVALSSLFVGEISNESLIRRRADQERIHNPNEKGAVYHGLTPGPLKSNVELLMMSLSPDNETNEGFSQHFEEEIAYVAEGEAVILFEDEEFILSQGDTVRILPSRKHKFRNPGAVPVKILFIKSKVNY